MNNTAKSFDILAISLSILYIIIILMRSNKIILNLHL